MNELFKIFGTIAIKNNEANDAIDDTTEKAKTSSSNIGTAFKKIGTAVATYFAVDKIVDFGTKCVEAAAEVKAMNSQFEQTFGDMANEANNAIGSVAESSGILQTRLNGVGTQIFAFAKSSGAESAEAMELMQTALQATADSAAYYDKSLEETAESLQSFLKGNFANDAALGVSATETTRNAAAMELFGQKYNDLTEFQKQQTLLKMVTDAQELSGAMGQAARESDGWENVMGNLSETWKQFQANVGAPLLEGLVPVIQSITESLSGMGDIASSIGYLVADVINAALPIVIQLLTMLLPIAIEIIQTVLPVASTLLTSLSPLISELTPLIEAVLNVAMALLVPVTEFLVNILPPIIDLVTKIIQMFIPQTVEALNWVADVVKNILNATFKNIEPFIANVLSLFGGITTFLKGIFTHDMQSALDGVVTILKGIVNTVSSIINMALNGIIDGINILFDGAVKLLNLIPDINISANVPKIPNINIPMLAKGGTITGSGNVIVGEQGAELLSLPSGATVTPLKENTMISKADLRDAFIEALQTVGISLELSADSDAIFDSVVKTNITYKRRHNGISALT